MQRNYSRSPLDIKLTRDKVLAIDPDALEYYQYATDPMQNTANDTLERAMDDYENIYLKKKLTSF